jgi:hypothetical protein
VHEVLLLGLYTRCHRFLKSVATFTQQKYTCTY